MLEGEVFEGVRSRIEEPAGVLLPLFSLGPGGDGVAAREVPADILFSDILYENISRLRRHDQQSKNIQS